MLKKFFLFVSELLKVIIVSLLIVIPVRMFIVQPFFVQGSSMEPNFKTNEYLLVDEINYRFNQPRRGDVIVFRYPKNPSQFYIKRVIGLPGERLKIENSQVTIYNANNPEGLKLNEGYLGNNIQTPGSVDITLEKDNFFVLGDNRGASSDSREWGTLEKKFIIGRAWLRIFPFNRAMAISDPSY